MERIVLFGKGGIGKSTVAANVSGSLAAAGMRVLHVGCDPKHDSTASLLGGRMIEPVIDRIHRVRGVTPEDIVTRSHLGVDCVEAGGPSAGVGCGGRGITRMLEIFAEANLLAEGRYDVALYDVLGDVVCGGFAAPLRKDIGEKIVIVASEEVMALYAANNIAKAVVHYAENGVHLAGIIINLKDNAEDRAPIERFARLIGTQILDYIPRDPLIREAEYRQKTAIEHAPGSAIARRYGDLARRLLDIDAARLPLPTPLGEAEFYEYVRRKFAPLSAAAGAPEPQRTAPERPDLIPAAEILGPGRSAKEADASRRKDEFAGEVRAGARAVRLGLVSLEVAISRLKAHYPEEARRLCAADLLA